LGPGVFGAVSSGTPGDTRGKVGRGGPYGGLLLGDGATRSAGRASGSRGPRSSAFLPPGGRAPGFGGASSGPTFGMGVVGAS
jgi:hypothetical protein